MALGLALAAEPERPPLDAGRVAAELGVGTVGVLGVGFLGYAVGQGLDRRCDRGDLCSVTEGGTVGTLVGAMVGGTAGPLLVSGLGRQAPSWKGTLIGGGLGAVGLLLFREAGRYSGSTAASGTVATLAVLSVPIGATVGATLGRRWDVGVEVALVPTVDGLALAGRF